MTEQSGGTKDGVGGGDHDSSYIWGSPRSFLDTRSLAKLIILRGYVLDAKHGEGGGIAEGDVPERPDDEKIKERSAKEQSN